MKIRERRVELDFSLGELARKCGLGTSVMSRIERGLEGRPPENVIKTIARHLQCTPEEITADLPEIPVVDELPKVLVALKAVQVEAKKMGLGVGNGGRGEIRCPVCKTGDLRYSVAGVNGHIWGRCSTEGCVAWMQ